MKHIVSILIGICLLALPACSGDTEYEKDIKNSTESIVAFNDLRIELDSDGYIVKPEWMKNLVSTSVFILSQGTKTPGIMRFSGVYIDGTPYIKTGLTYSSDLCTAFQVYKIDGEPLACNSQEYKKVRDTETKDRILWKKPSPGKPVATIDELQIELDSKGYITKPEWMKEIVDANRYPLPDGGSGYGVMHFCGVRVENTPYIVTSITYASDLCKAFQVYRLNGEKVACDSQEYKEVAFYDRGTYSILWSLPR